MTRGKYSRESVIHSPIKPNRSTERRSWLDNGHNTQQKLCVNIHTPPKDRQRQNCCSLRQLSLSGELPCHTDTNLTLLMASRHQGSWKLKISHGGRWNQTVYSMKSIWALATGRIQEGGRGDSRAPVCGWPQLAWNWSCQVMIWLAAWCERLLCQSISGSCYSHIQVEFYLFYYLLRSHDVLWVFTEVYCRQFGPALDLVRGHCVLVHKCPGQTHDIWNIQSLQTS